MEFKICTSCGKEKSVADFHKFGKDGSRVGKWCEDCYAKKAAGKPVTTQKQLPSKPN